MIPAGPQAFLRRVGVVPVTGEDVRPADQELSSLAVGDIRPIVVDQPDPRALCDPHDWPALQTEGQISNGSCCSPDVVEGRAKDRSDHLLQIDRADIRSAQTDSQGLQITRPGSLASDQGRILGRETKAPGATMALNDVEDSVGVETLKQDERSTELNKGQKSDDSAHVRQGQGLDHHTVIRKSPMLDHQVCRFR
jgi:hypothetical protein